jgi:hypothetical protein
MSTLSHPSHCLLWPVKATRAAAAAAAWQSLVLQLLPRFCSQLLHCGARHLLLLPSVLESLRRAWIPATLCYLKQHCCIHQ